MIAAGLYAPSHELPFPHRLIFGRVGRGYAKKLRDNGLYTMGDIASLAIADEDYLYRLFGINAEYLIDHAFGYENTTIADVKAFLVDCGLQEELRCVDEDEVVKQVIKAAKETKSRTAFQKKLTALLAPTAYKHISAKIYDKIFDKLEDLRAMVADNEAN